MEVQSVLFVAVFLICINITPSHSSECPGLLTGYYTDSFIFCVSPTQCKQRSFVILGDACLRRCPIGTKLFEDTSNCYTVCPNNTVEEKGKCLNASHCLQENTVFHDGRCISQCPGHLSLVENGVCVNRCSDERVIHNEQCIDKDMCIGNISGVVFNQTCVTECPDETPYTYGGECQGTCPGNMVVVDNICQNTSFCIDTQTFAYDHTCVKNCPDSAIYVDNGVCLSKCPEGKVFSSSNDTNCIPVKECIDQGGFVTSNSTCTSQCPVEVPWDVHGRCTSECPEGYVLEDTHCITTSDCTTKGLFLDNSTCVANCPMDMRFHCNHECCYQCQKDYVADSDECISKHECLSWYGKFGVIYNGSCLTRCPESAPLLSRSHCVSECPPGTFDINSQCLDDKFCSKYNYNLRFNDRCVLKCPNTAPYIDGRQCISNCSSNKVADEGHCITTKACISKGKYVYNTTCQVSCPHYHKNGICYAKCPKGTVSNETRCVPPNHCKRVYEDRCVEICPAGYNFTVPKSGVCYAKCPQGSLSNGTRCVSSDECKLIYQDRCVDKCPGGYNYILNKDCIQKCPDNTFRNDSRCIPATNCTQPRKFYNKTCIDVCPPTAPFTFNATCLQGCPVNYTPAIDHMCVLPSRCKRSPNGSIFYNAAACLLTCPSDFKFADGDNKCVKHCTGGKIIKDTECITQSACRDVVYLGQCLQSCPSAAPYRKDSACYQTCPGDTYAQGLNCVSRYQCRKYVHNKTCVDTCPDELPFIYTKKCSSSCPPDTYKVANECKYKTSCTGFIYNNTCLKSCPVEARINIDQTCHANCPKNTLRQGTTCIYEILCEGFKYNETCMEQCPSNARYTTSYFGTDLMKECHPKCPDGYPIIENGTNCIPLYLCKGRVAENRCVTVCPRGYANDTSDSMYCTDLNKPRYSAIVVSILSVVGYTCLFMLVYNPSKRTMGDRSAEEVNQEDPDTTEVKALNQDPDMTDIKTLNQDPDTIEVKALNQDPDMTDVKTLNQDPDTIEVKALNQDPHMTDVKTLNQDPEDVEVVVTEEEGMTDGTRATSSQSLESTGDGITLLRFINESFVDDDMLYCSGITNDASDISTYI